MATLSNILRDSLVKLGQLQVFTATGGTTETIVDSDLGGTDNDFVRGTMIVIRDAGGSSAAPENEFAEIIGYTSSTGTITGASNAFTASPASGDTYGISNGKDYPHQQMIEEVNIALQALSDIPLIDTSITTAASQTEYALPVALKRQPPYRVDLQMITTDANNNQWKEIDRGRWEYVPAVGGSTALLIIRDQLPIGRLFRIWYKHEHTSVRIYSDIIYEGIHPERLVWETVYQALLWKNGQQPGDEGIIAQLQNAENKRIDAAAEHTIWKPPRRSKLLIVKGAVEKDVFTVPGPP